MAERLLFRKVDIKISISPELSTLLFH